MKIAVLAANGRLGSLIVKEAAERGNDVTAIAREKNKTVAKKFLKRDIFDLTEDDVKDFDVVITAFGAWTEETLPLYKTTTEHLANILANKNTRLLVVGGAGSLYTDESFTTQLFTTPDFPTDYYPIASNAAKGLDVLRKRNDVKWTYVSPAAEFEYDWEKKGEYELAGEVFTVNAEGKSELSYADYAIAMVDEAEKGNHINQRISVLWK
ncbi:NADH-flavin reductase [Fusobacterium polymorphum]|uniref:NADH-flavin reductase n=1 Tax=Fusobacterium nucleatum subsp. polymorphum TaxID=76857 RepID=A0A2B7YKU5_FUSNP|nr:NAD(P)-dependent oxidoreductase [Fusobacterium polymorphum]PGH21689.1 NADH-flavin reductase [Fusobacterium polymorphum]